MTPLILVPTPLEMRVLRPRLGAAVERLGGAIELAGLGLVSAAAAAAIQLARRAPGRALLVGIAGALDEKLAIGHAYTFDSVRCCGLGVGDGAERLSFEQLGWRHWSDAKGSNNACDAIGDMISLPAAATGFAAEGGLLLSCAAASGNAADAARKRSLWPAAAAEDMEGFGVALGGQLAGVPVDVIRGISNRAGDRDKRHWRIEPALEAAADAALRWLAGAPFDAKPGRDRHAASH